MPRVTIKMRRQLGPARWIVAALALIVVVAGCGSDGTGIGSATASDAEAEATAQPAAESNPTDARSVEETKTNGSELIPIAGGGQIDWNSLEGQDVVLWFWAPW